MKEIKLTDLFKYKEFLMGIAGLWVLYYHSGLQLFGTYIKNIGYGGVDIFLFLSGMGCYCSLNKDNNPANFIYRRIKRIIPTYLLCYILWLIVDYVVKFKNVPTKSIIGNVFGVQILGSQYKYAYAWYVTVLWICYFLTPIFKSIVDSLKSPVCFWVLLVLILFFSFSFWGEGNLILVFSRLPIYFIGIYIGKMGNDGYAISKKFIVISALGLILGFSILYITKKRFAGYLWSRGLFWYPFIMIAPTFCSLTSYLLEINSGKRIVDLINDIGIHFGKYSFEMYLVQLIIFEVIKNGHNFKKVSTIGGNVLWTVSMIGVIGTSMILHYMIDKICKYLKT